MSGPYQQRGLGDAVEEALSAIGITDKRVARWLGRPCNCKQRKEKLNQLSAWALRVLKGKVENAEKYLDEMLQE